MYERMPGQRFASQPSAAPPAVPDGWQTASSAPPPVTAQRYRSSAPAIAIVIAIVVAALVIALVWSSTRPKPSEPAASASSSPASTAPAEPTPSPGWQGIQFATSTSAQTGYWQVSAGQWNGDSVSITTTVTSTKGALRFTFFVLDNQMSNFYDPVGGTMAVGSLAAGQTQTGTVMFELPHGDFTLYLATIKGAQIAALIISG